MRLISEITQCYFIYYKNFKNTKKILMAVNVGQGHWVRSVLDKALLLSFKTDSYNLSNPKISKIWLGLN